MQLTLNLNESSYEIIIEKGVLNSVGELIPRHNKFLLISDDKIPNQYIEILKRQFSNIYVARFPAGEASKTIQTFEALTDELIKNEFTRKDAIIALGGGVTSDLAGYVASCYMRGIDFYIIPTTLLSQTDASIGGKVAVNHNGIKNIIGAFYQPKKVIIDPDTLKTLQPRLYNEGVAEIIKMAAIYDANLFEKLEKCTDFEANIEEILYQALLIKKDVVEKDEKEANLRSILNFGHTVGHAIEAKGNGRFYHGEAVAIGMMYLSFGEAKSRIEALLRKYHLPVKDDYDNKELLELIKLDKKAHDDKIKVVIVNKIGSYELKDISFSDLYQIMEGQKYEK